MYDVAICQFDMVWEDFRTNLVKTEALVRAADARLVVLPEMFATGFVTDPERIAQPMTGEIVRAMRRWAAEEGKAVAGSVVIEEAGAFYNRFLFVTPDGKVTAYDKRHLFSIGGEGEAFRAGNRRVVVEWGGVRYLLLVCYDLRFPVWARYRGDYDAILCVASWPAPRRDVWRALLPARAIENQVYVFGVNRIGADPTTHYVGDSMGIDPRGGVLFDAMDQEGIFYADIDLEALVRFREKFPAWRDADDFELKGV